MRILWFYRYEPNYNFDHWLHMDFTEWLKVYSGAKVKCYGHRLHEAYPNFVVMPWKTSLVWGLVMSGLFVIQIIVNLRSHPKMSA